MGQVENLPLIYCYLIYFNSINFEFRRTFNFN